MQRWPKVSLTLVALVTGLTLCVTAPSAADPVPSESDAVSIGRTTPPLTPVVSSILAARKATTRSGVTTVVVNGRVQTCSWSYTEFTGTVCRGPVTWPVRRLRVTMAQGFVLFLEVWNPTGRRWEESPYNYDPKTRRATIDGSQVDSPAPPVGVLTRRWVDFCDYWVYTARSHTTSCWTSHTELAVVRRGSNSVVWIRGVDGRLHSNPWYVYRSEGHGYFAFDAARLPHPATHLQPALPAIADSVPGRVGSPSSYLFIRTDNDSPRSYCAARPVTVHVDYAGATAEGVTPDVVRAAVNYAMNDAAHASGYRLVWGADVHAPAATLFTSGPARVPDNQLVITFDTPKVAAYDNSRVEVSKSPTGIFGILGVGGPRYNLPTDPSEGPPRQTGYVVLSAEYFAGVNATLRDDLTLHEIGHTFGLDHVDDVTQVMFPDIVAAATDPLPHYGAGDAAGLRLLRSHSLTGC